MVDYKALIEQELKRDNAEKNIAKEVKKNKLEIVIPFAEQIWDFLKIINEDKNFLFNSEAHPRDKDWTTLCRDYDYDRKYHLSELKKYGGVRFLTRSFGYGSNASRYLHIGIGDDFKPYGALTNGLTVEQDEKRYSVEEFINELLTFFIKRKK